MSSVGHGDAIETDVAIVGAGPAGCLLGYLLARSGARVDLFERHDLRNREFRGYFWQPAAVRLFDEMGLLDAIRELDHEEVRRPSVTVEGRRYEVMDLEALPGPGYGLLMEQEALLALLVDRASEYEGFTFRPHTPVEDLLTDDEGRVVGLRATDREGDRDLTVGTRLVVGADGRYSTVRRAAGIDAGLFDSRVELVWFKLPREAAEATAQARITAEGLLLYFGLGREEAQLGWFVGKGEYPDLRAAGIETFCDRVAAVDPRLRPYLRDHVDGFEECSLLHIEPGLAPEWVRDGLLLVGDAAHVASPVGGQGNSLAAADTVVAHPVVLDALAGGSGPLTTDRLARYESTRRPDVESVLRLQRRGERVLTALVLGRGRVPGAVFRTVARALFAVGPQLPRARRTFELFALGPRPVHVETARFVDSGPVTDRRDPVG